jgi:hypothetical protein
MVTHALGFNSNGQLAACLERQTGWFADDLQKTRTMKDAAWGESLPNFPPSGIAKRVTSEEGGACRPHKPG